MARHSILITGASGEVGHSLIEHFVREDQFNIIALDLKPVAVPKGAHGFVSIIGDVTNEKMIHEIFENHDIRQVFHLAAVLSSGGERNPEKTHHVNVEGSFNLISAAKIHGQRQGEPVRFIFPSTIAVYGIPTIEAKNSSGKTKEDQFLSPITMYGINKLYVENLGRYYSTSYKLLEANPGDVKLDFRAVRFPGLMSAETLPSGGTSDYASEMIHSCAQRKPYSCFVSPAAKIPFMAMPDGVRALIELAKVPREKLSQRTYNVGAFAVTAGEIAKELHKEFPDAQISYNPDKMRESIVDSWPADLDDSKARQDWGWKPEYLFESAFAEYLIPGIAKKYR